MRLRSTGGGRLVGPSALKSPHIAGHADNRLVEMNGPGRAVELGVAEGEDAAVGGRQPVALAVRSGSHADNRLVEMNGPGRAVELGVAEGEDAAVGGRQPVALAVRSGSHADNRLVEMNGPGRAVELGVAEGEDPAVGGRQPVAGGGQRRSYRGPGELGRGR